MKHFQPSPTNEHPVTPGVAGLQDSVQVFSALFSDLSLAESFSALSEDEVLRCHSFQIEKARREFILSRGFLRQTLAPFLNLSPQRIPIFSGIYGKPFLKEPYQWLSFNLSHSGNRVVVAISKDRALGIDIEKIQFHQDLSIAHEVFSVAELEELNNLKDSQKTLAFFKGWTQKEAFIKALGLGFSYPLKQFTVLLDPSQEGRLLFVKDDPSKIFQKNWSMQCLDLDPAYSCSVFAQGPNVIFTEGTCENR